MIATVDCAFIVVGQEGPKWRMRCERCGFSLRSPTPNPLLISAVCGSAAQETTEGPGKELMYIIEVELELTSRPGCGCHALARKMNHWGCEVCRKNRKWLVEKIEKNAAEYGWGDVIGAATRAIKKGLIFQINPFDKYGSLVDLAIARAAAQTLG